MVLSFVSLERDERRGLGYSWNHWCQDDAPLLFGTPDDGFASDDSKTVILTAHRHIIKTTQEMTQN
jgi:hypothetical protein